MDARLGRAAVTGHDASDARTKAHRRVQTPVIKLPNFGDTPCALCVKGDLEVKGTATMNAISDTSCGNKYGATTSGTLCLGEAGDPADPNWGNTGSINGATDATRRTTSRTTPAQRRELELRPFTLTASQLDALRALARDYGTYYTGETEFNSSNRVRAKPIVFVDGDMRTSGTRTSGAPTTAG